MNDGTFLKNGFYFNGNGTSRTYAIDGKYSAITGVFALTQTSKNETARCVLTITVDGKEYTLDEVTAGVRPVAFDIPLSNVHIPEAKSHMHGEIEPGRRRN